MHDPNTPTVRAWNAPPGPGGFPGLSPGFGNPGFGGDPFFSGPPAIANPTVIPPFGAPGQGFGGPKGFSLGELKGLIDRMGGIDGVLNGISKFQKLISAMQQMAPLIRLFLNKAQAAALSEGVISIGSEKRKPAGRRRRGPRGRRRTPARRRQRL